ncbi:MAG: hypothetical protein WED04_12155 [Promethearchaeati archaeon SRVP18_Atabeyarchaeia-1]
MDLPRDAEIKLRAVCSEMLQYLNHVKVVSRLELFVKAREILAKVELSPEEEESIGREFSLRSDQLTVISIIGETPYMMGCPFLHEETRFKNVLFYHSHTFSPDESDLESAVARLRSIRTTETDKMISNILSKAGYSKTSENQGTGLRTYRKEGSGVILNCIILESVNDAARLIDAVQEGTILGVPTEDTPAPFISIYRKYRGRVAEGKISIIVVNIEDQRISPFLGYPSDKDLTPLFNEPDLAVRIRSIWGEEGEEELT